MTNLNAVIDWQAGQPYSAKYQDVYFSSDSGLAETEHVFLRHNQLHERWQQLAATRSHSPLFTIAETGFGTGLNFLCAWQLWNKVFASQTEVFTSQIESTANAERNEANNQTSNQTNIQIKQSPARLHFISTEIHPLSYADLQSALALWPSLAPLSNALLAQYHMLAPGWQRLVFDHGRVTLTLLIGDILQTLPQLKANVDAWFLDGFSPAKNPAMWQPALFHTMADLSHQGTSFATFTSAGAVKRGLQEAGFTVRKVAGFGRKREMLCGHLHRESSEELADLSKSSIQSQYAGLSNIAQSNNNIETQTKTQSALTGIPVCHPVIPTHAIVIGGGIAGCASSHALAQRGIQVTLIERHATLAQEASGNPVGILYPRLAAGDAVLGKLGLTGYLHSLRLLKALASHPSLDKNPSESDTPPAYTMASYEACGVLQLAFDDRELARCMAIAEQGLPDDVLRYVDAAAASELAGIRLAHGGLYFPAAGWVAPSEFCHALAQHEHITIKQNIAALRLTRNEDSKNWQVWDTSGLVAEAPVVIIAGAHDSLHFSQASHCELDAVRGQISHLPQTEGSSALRTVLCSDGYITPSSHGLHCIGATFTPGELGTEVKEADHSANLAMLQRMLPDGFIPQHSATELDTHQLSTLEVSALQLQGRAALRCTTKDYLPVAGPLLDAQALGANPPRHTAAPQSLPWLTGLYINSGHGSKGLVTAPLCAELIVGAICGEPAAAERNLLIALDPNRFLLRSMGLKRLVQGLAAFP